MSASIQDPEQTVDYPVLPLTMSPANGCVAATNLPTIPTTAGRALVQAESQNIRWRCDGSAPTASNGMLLTAGSDILIVGKGAMAAFQCIQVTATATFNVHYFT